MDGAAAFQLVCAYSAFGVQRTGSPGNEGTKRWLAGELSARGANVVLEAYPYQWFHGEVSVAADGRAIEAMPLYYSAVGARELVNPAVGVVDAHADEPAIERALAGLINDAKSQGKDGLVLATECPTGALCAINREQSARLDFPVLLIAGDAYDTARGSELAVRYSGSIQPGEAENLVARFLHSSDASRVVITTPISGWFTCAGERGCGLAVAIHLAELMSETFPVDLLLATGHELGFAGGYHLAESYAGNPACIIHLGSCIANVGADMVAICSAGADTTNRIAAALAPLNIQPVSPRQPGLSGNWVGESKCWAAHNKPMLSIAGQAAHFHTAFDRTEDVTSTELLQRAMDAIGEAARALTRGELLQGAQG